MFVDVSWNNKKEIISSSTVIVWGDAYKNRDMLPFVNAEKIIVVDINSDKWGADKNGFLIQAPQSIEKYPKCVIVSALTNHADEILSMTEIYENEFFFYFDDARYSKIEKIKSINDVVESEDSQDYKYVHWFINTPFCISFYSMIEERYNIEDHLFVIDYEKELEDKRDLLTAMIGNAQRNGNVIFVDDYLLTGTKNFQKRLINRVSSSEWILKKIDKAKKTIIHSAYFHLNAVDILEKAVLMNGNRMYWIVFGQDGLLNLDEKIVQDVILKLNCAICKEEFCSRIEERFGIRVLGSHWSYGYLNSKFKMINSGGLHKTHRNILLGHSAVPTNKIEIGIRDMSQFSEEDITIYAPLSYGDMDYRDSVIAEGKKVFGTKFVPMTEYMSGDEYYEFLQTIDIGVFPMVEMKAGTTITFLQSIGAKIYLRKKFMTHCEKREPLYDFWDYELLKNQEYDGFSLLKGKRDPQSVISNNNDFIVKEWRNVFEL